jgi:dihydropteroate synthase
MSFALSNTVAELSRRIGEVPSSGPAMLMGVLNLTPDSFSDGGLHPDPAAAEASARKMLAEGADLLDLGPESTRPGSQPVPEEEQLARLLPVLRRLGAVPGMCPITVDTTRAVVARAALDLGAVGINDISAGRDDPGMFRLAAESGCLLVLMHMQGTPATMQAKPSYTDVVAEVSAFLAERLSAARAAGVRADRLLADPGIGFGKTLEHNLDLLRHLARLRLELGVPLLVGTSRKGFLGTLTGRSNPADRVFATAGSLAWACTNGAGVLRVHDVAAARDACLVASAIAGRP